MNEMLPALIGFFGVLVGAIVHSQLSRNNEKQKHLSELQNKAYADFLNSASNIAVYQRKGKSNLVNDELAKLADAKSRICVYGEPIVIEKMAKFFRKGGTLQTESELLAFTSLCISIRKSIVSKKDAVHIPDMSQLLFSIDIKDTPTPG